MTGFFANLINRHRGRAETVAPRAHSYFEEASTPEVSEVEVLSHGNVQSRRDQPFADSSRSDAAQSELLRPETLEPNGRITTPQNPQITSSGANGSKSDTRVENAVVHSTGVRGLPVSDFMQETNQRIDAVLDRINGFANPRARHGVTDTQLNVLGYPERDHNDAGVDAAPSPGLPGNGLMPGADTGPSVLPGQDDGPGESVSQVSLDRGGLEAPEWLKQPQSEFESNRTRFNHQPEPVINVSIGRVEVRAIRESKPRPGSSKARPSGVMSLDEYLSKRQRKGVV